MFWAHGGGPLSVIGPPPELGALSKSTENYEA